MTFYLSDEFLENARDGILPPELTTGDLKHSLTHAWDSTREMLKCDNWVLDEVREELDEEYTPVEWWRALRRAGHTTRRLLCVVPLSKRNYGSGDLDDSALYSLFFESLGQTFKVKAYPFIDVPQPADMEPTQAITVLMNAVYSPERSLSMDQWKHWLLGATNNDDSRLLQFFRSRRPHLYGGDERIPDSGVEFRDRRSLDAAALDIIEMQARSVAICAYEVGSTSINANLALVNETLDSLTSQLISGIDDVLKWLDAGRPER